MLYYVLSQQALVLELCSALLIRILEAGESFLESGSKPATPWSNRQSTPFGYKDRRSSFLLVDNKPGKHPSVFFASNSQQSLSSIEQY